MAEYYPLLAKAVASLPNSTPDSRKVVYERARKALIGQLRTLHPPVPDEDIERESVALDSAVARLEAELGAVQTPLDASLAPDAPNNVAAKEAEAAPKQQTTTPARFPPTGGALGPSATGKPAAPLRTKFPPPKTPAQRLLNGAPPAGAAAASSDMPKPATAAPPSADRLSAPETLPVAATAAASTASESLPPSGSDFALAPPVMRDALIGEQPRARPDQQRPFAPQPPTPKQPKRRLWIIPAGIGLVVVLVAFAAYKLRDRPDSLTHHAADQQTPTGAGKVVQRATSTDQADTGIRSVADQGTTGSSGQTQQAQGGQQPPNPAAPVAGRAALLVEAPDEPNADKVKTYLGTVVWRLDNVSDDQNQGVGLAVRAEVDLPDDRMKATIVFQKNADASLPASHTMKIRFMLQPGSPTGNVKEINVPQMRREDSSSGDPLDGVTVPIVENSFLIGLTPGNSETANLTLLRGREWIDIPMRLSNGRIAKMTFEKTDAGQRDLQEAIAAWAKQ